MIQLTPFSFVVDKSREDGGNGLNPLVLMEPNDPSFGIVILVESDSVTQGSSDITCFCCCCCCCSISMCLNDGTSPLQYLRHILRYDDSKPTVNFGPSQTEDLYIRSRRFILRVERAFTSEANCNANWTYSSSVLATRCPKPVLLQLVSNRHHYRNVSVTVVPFWGHSDSESQTYNLGLFEIIFCFLFSFFFSNFFKRLKT